MQLSAHFSLEEFERASDRPLSPQEVAAADWWANAILEPLRGALQAAGGDPRIIVSSFVRSGGNIGKGCHKDGSAVDFYTADVSRLREAFDWLRIYKIGELGELLHEPYAPGGAHNHAARYPCGGRHEALVMRADGTFERGAAVVAGAAGIAGILVVVLLALAFLSR